MKTSAIIEYCCPDVGTNKLIHLFSRLKQPRFVRLALETRNVFKHRLPRRDALGTPKDNLDLERARRDQCTCYLQPLHITGIGKIN
ncbi:hypothetical protein L596_003191 [Steinernema carpocapsae]|uniref:Uncharacterized protein n=1 Tax=Steinernema carpocapsae TaxID=34508 RepID=A0A4U8UTE4_STECR|nr:hypothetical protein L596_003191 [Steinernema carpocapsae]